MTYRFADTEDLDQLVAMSDQAKESLKQGISINGRRGSPTAR